MRRGSFHRNRCRPPPRTEDTGPGPGRCQWAPPVRTAAGEIAATGAGMTPASASRGAAWL